MNLEKRLIDLETKISFQDQVIEDLSSTIYKQQQQIDQLTQNLEIFKMKIQASLEAENEIRPHEKPPHY